MLGDRLIATGGAKLVGAQALACIVLTLLLGLSIVVNVLQVRGKARAVGAVEAQLAAVVATAGADRATCETVNRNVNATVAVLGDELHACRGSEQKLDDARRLALRQRERARQAADGEARMRREAIEAIVRRDENCSRPVCRALSDELLGHPAEVVPE